MEVAGIGSAVCYTEVGCSGDRCSVGDGISEGPFGRVSSGRSVCISVSEGGVAGDSVHMGNCVSECKKACMIVLPCPNVWGVDGALDVCDRVEMKGRGRPRRRMFEGILSSENGEQHASGGDWVGIGDVSIRFGVAGLGESPCARV